MATNEPSRFATLSRLLREFSIPLIAGVVTALVWANVSYESYDHAIHDRVWNFHSLHFITNDVFMVLFFGIAAAEIASSFAPGGSLNPVGKALNPLLATVGGVVGPVGAYFLLNLLMGGPELARGWGIPTATDIAVAWLVARLAFGAGHPCVSFLLLLAVADDAISLAIIAIFYPSLENPIAPIWLLLVLLGIALAFALNRLRVRSYWPYLGAAGVCAWLGLHEANLHPALALVFIVPFMPHHPSGSDLGDRHATTLSSFEHDWKVLVDFGMFLFGLCNAGVQFSAVGSVTAIILLSLLLGKTVGVTGFAYAGSLLGLPLPAGIGLRELIVTAMITGIGLTVSLFVAGEAFADPVLRDAAKMGALASAVIGPLALLLARLLGIRPRGGTETN